MSTQQNILSALDKLLTRFTSKYNNASARDAYEYAVINCIAGKAEKMRKEYKDRIVDAMRTKPMPSEVVSVTRNAEITLICKGRAGQRRLDERQLHIQLAKAGMKTAQITELLDASRVEGSPQYLFEATFMEGATVGGGK